MQLGHADFFSQVKILLKGNVIAQLLPILTLPIATRFYTVDEFALFTTYTAIAQLLCVVASGRYEYAILLPDNDKDAASLKLLSLYLIAITQVLFVLVALIFADFFTALLGIPAIRIWLWTIPITALFMSLYQVLSYEATRFSQFSQISNSRIQQATVQSVSRIAFGFLAFGNLGLVLSNFIGFFASCFVFFKNKISFQSTFQDIKRVGVRYINFPKYGVLDGLLNMLAMQVPVFLFANFYGVASVGHFGMAIRILSLPAAFLALSIGQSYYKSITTTPSKTGELTALLLSKLSKLGLIPLFLTCIGADFAFALLLGDNWREAGVYAMYLAPWLYLSFILSPISFLFDALEQQRYVLFYSIANFILRGTLLCAIFYWGFDVYTNLLVFSAAGVLMWIFFLYKITKEVKLNFKSLVLKLILLPTLVVVSAIILRKLMFLLFINS